MKFFLIIFFLALVSCGDNKIHSGKNIFDPLVGKSEKKLIDAYGKPFSDNEISHISSYKKDKGPWGALAKKYFKENHHAASQPKIRELHWKDGEYYNKIWLINTNGQWVSFGGFRAHIHTVW